MPAASFPIDHRNKQTHDQFMDSSVIAKDRDTNPDALRRSGRRIGTGRGATLNPSSRYDALTYHVVDDEWQTLDELPPFKTEVSIERPRSVLTRNQSPDIAFDRSVNPYRGCEHGCSYCFARPSHAYLGLSPGLDFETQLTAKPNAAELLEKEISHKGYEPRTIALGTNTDPYQPIEKQYRVTREILKVLEAANHPVAIVTKSAMVTRDVDILTRMAAKNLAKVAISITTLDRRISRAMEPRAAAPGKRLKAIKTLSEAGIPVNVMVAPVIPALTDGEMERILTQAHAHGAREAGYIVLRLPREVSPLFRDWLQTHFPDRYAHVMSLMQGMRGGKDYEATFGKRMRGEGAYAWQIGRRFEIATRKIGLNETKHQLDTDQFVPPLSGSGTQLRLL